MRVQREIVNKNKVVCSLAKLHLELSMHPFSLAILVVHNRCTFVLSICSSIVLNIAIDVSQDTYKVPEACSAAKADPLCLFLARQVNKVTRGFQISQLTRAIKQRLGFYSCKTTLAVRAFVVSAQVTMDHLGSYFLHLT